MQNEKKYCIRLRFIEPPRVIARVRTRRAHERARSSARSAKASVSQVHSTITRRHTPLIFAHVFLPGQRLRRNFYFGFPFVPFEDRKWRHFFLSFDQKGSVIYFNPLEIRCYYYDIHNIIILILLIFITLYYFIVRDGMIYKNFHNEKRGRTTSWK